MSEESFNYGEASLQFNEEEGPMTPSDEHDYDALRRFWQCDEQNKRFSHNDPRLLLAILADRDRLAERLARVEGALKWCQNDIRYKAPEQLTPAYFGSLLDKATQALEVE